VRAKRSKTAKANQAHRRTVMVWSIFVASMSIVSALLAMHDPAPTSGFVLTNVEVIGPKPAGDAIFQISKPLDRQRWTGIVIHDSGTPAGDADSIHREHLGLGYKGLGYHFLIGNGNGLGDGVIHVGFRWNEQLPGAHVLGPNAMHHNQHSIAICLIGNGDRRSFTDNQLTQLATLVRRLQQQLRIPAKNVRFHRDLYPQTSSPGRFFPLANFQQQLLD
jgi:hypothetical protein